MGIQYLALDSWAGRRLHAVEVLGETPKKARVRITTADGVMLPGRRRASCGDVVLVPKDALFDPEPNSLVGSKDRSS